jgi:hypothetical protein
MTAATCACASRTRVRSDRPDRCNFSAHVGTCERRGLDWYFLHRHAKA